MEQANETDPIVRFSGAWWAYSITRAGFLRAVVNSIEDSLAVSGRFLLLTYLFYLGAQVGALLIAPSFSWPLPLEMGMFVLQIAGLEGSIPGLARQAETLRTEKEDEKQAHKIERVMLSARLMTICAFGEGAAYALGLDHRILQIASAILMVARGVVITGFLIELAKIEKKAPRVISRKAHAQAQAEKQAQLEREQALECAAHECEMARLAQPVIPDARVQELIQQALADQAQHYHQVFAQQAAQIDHLVELTTYQSQMLATLQPSLSESVPAGDNQAIIAGVISELEARFTSAMKRMESEVEQRVRVSLVGGTGQDGTYGSVSLAQGGTQMAGPKLVSLPSRSVPLRTPKQPAVERSTPAKKPTESGEVIDYKSHLYRLLDEDNTRQVPDLMQMTGYPKTTVWRWWRRYHEENGTRGQARIISGEVEETAAVETA